MKPKILCHALRMAFIVCLLFAKLSYGENLSLNQAIEKTLQQNPSLQAFAVKKQALDQKRETEALAPELALGLEIENVLGTGDTRGFDSGEYTLSIGSVIELGNKADTRVAAVHQEGFWLDATKKVAALDMISKVSETYILAINSMQLWQLAKAQVSLGEETLQAVKKRQNIGLLSSAELERSKADLAKAQLLQRQYFYQLQSQKAMLAGFWGEIDGEQYVLDESLFYKQPAIKPKSVLLQQLEQSPLLEALSAQERLSVAHIKRSRSESSVDIAWSVGVKKQQENGDYSMTAGVSVPLFSKQRSSAKVQQQIVQSQEIGYQKRQQLLQLQQSLGQSYQRYQMAIDATESLDSTIIPALTNALKTIHQGYLKGRFNYLEWADIQKQLLSAKQDYIESHTQAWLIRNDIERMTGLDSQQMIRNTP